MKNGILTARQWALCGVAAACLLPFVAAAADAEDQGPAPAASSGARAAPAQSATLEEVIVTAQKRAESLDKVGLAVSVLSADALKDRQITSLQDLTAAIPSMSYAESPTSNPIVTLRGVGFYDTTLSATPAVSLYMNQVPLAYPIMASHGIFDLERVEVLKGPQGILFGENSTGGAINYIPAAPTKTNSAGVSVGYGSYNTLTEDAFISGPITDTLRFRASESADYGDGWQKSVTQPGLTNGDKRLFEGRLLVDFEPTDRAKFELNINGWRDQGQPQAAQLIGFDLQHPGFADPKVFALPFAPQQDTAADWYSGLPKRDNTFWQASLRGDIDVLPDITLTSLTSYSSMSQNESEAWDGSPYLEDDYNPEEGKIRSIFQEVRLANSSADRFRWMVGGNYQHDSISQFSWYIWQNTSSAVLFGDYYGVIGNNIFYVNQTTESEAGFTNLEYDVNNQFTAKAGVRYTNQDLTSNNCGADPNPPYNLGGIFYGAGNYKPGECFPNNNLGYELNGVAPGTSGRFIDSHNENNVSWKAGLDWKPDDNSLYYVNIAKGYKTGGFPSIGASVWSQFLPLKQESLLDYEIGSKLSLFDRRVQLDGAAFYYDYGNKQLRSRDNDPVWGALDIVQNIPKSSVKGVELEATTRPFPGLTLTGGGSYTFATIDQYTGINAAGVQANFAGTAMPYAPKWNVNLDGEYVMPVNDHLTGFIGGTVTYHSSTTSIVGGGTNPTAEITNVSGPVFAIDGYTLVDLRAGLEGDRWKILVWGKNIFNTYYWTTVYPSFDDTVRYTGMPATFGVTVSYKM